MGIELRGRPRGRLDGVLASITATSGASWPNNAENAKQSV